MTTFKILITAALIVGVGPPILSILLIDSDEMHDLARYGIGGGLALCGVAMITLIWGSE